jgi:hypothetical protein
MAGDRITKAGVETSKWEKRSFERETSRIWGDDELRIMKILQT